MKYLVVTSELTDDPTRGGNAYWRHVVTRLRDHHEVIPITLDTIGLADGRLRHRTARAALLRAVLAHARTPCVALIDGALFRIVHPLLHQWKNAGITCIGFTQEDYLQRCLSWFKRWRRRPELAAFARGCHRHIVVSEQLATLYRPWNPAIHVVCPGITAAALGPAPEAHTVPTIVCCGIYTPVKGQHLVLDAIRILNDKRRTPFQVRFYGNRHAHPRYVQQLDASVQRAQLGDVVTLNGNLPQAELWQAMRQADILAFVACGEGYPLVVMEAMANGCCAVLNQRGPGPEQINEQSGRLVSATPRAIAHALDELLRDPVRLFQMRQHAWQQACTRFHDWDTTVSQFIAALPS